MAVNEESLQRLQLFNVTRAGRKELGRGSYAVVFEVMVQGTPCAAKEVHPILVSAKSKENFYKECFHSSQLLHPNIVQFMGIYYPSPTAELPWLVMELMHISLTGLIEKQEKEKKDIPFHFKLSILVDTCQGLQFLHSKKMAHRDLSSNNILLTKHLVAKIADLGMAKVLLADSQKHTLAPGTQVFMPPEALTDDGAIYGIAIDVFSLGCVCLHVINMKWPTPKPAKQVNKKGKVVALTELQRRQQYLTKFSQWPTLEVLVRQCLHELPKKRLAIGEILEGLRSIHCEHVSSEDDNIFQLYDSIANYKKLLEQKDLELAQTREQLQFEKQKSKQQLDNMMMEMTQKNEQLQMQLTLTHEQLLEAKEQLMFKDTQLAESKQQLQDLHSQVSVMKDEASMEDKTTGEDTSVLTNEMDSVETTGEGSFIDESTGPSSLEGMDRTQGMVCCIVCSLVASTILSI